MRHSPEPGSPWACRGSPARPSTGGRPSSTSASARTAGGSPTSFAAAWSRSTTAILEYEEAYRRFLRDRPALVRFLVESCGNVYDDRVENVFDLEYHQPHTASNHYQDISVRRVISELVDDPAWPDVVETAGGEADLVDLGTGISHRLPRARGFRGDALLQVREPTSPGYVLNPAVVPVHDPALITAVPGRTEWYHAEGCGHLSVEAFWQASKVVEVRYDRFLALGDARPEPLAGL